MLSYRHAFHAGNPADVHKHAVFCAILESLCEKPKPLTVIDVYAGAARYDLTGPEAAKNREFETGIGRIMGGGDAALELYRRSVRSANPTGRLSVYPGSPALALSLMRPKDCLIVNELHPTDSANLRRWARNDPRVHVHSRDAIEALTALLPPKIRRGVVLIDPPYEVKSDYEAVAKTLPTALQRWPQGTIMIWFPVLAEKRHEAILSAVSALDQSSTLVSIIKLKPPPQDQGLLASGIALVNPPWQFGQRLDDIEHALKTAFAPLTRGA